MTRKAAIKQARRELVYDVNQFKTYSLKHDFVKASLFLKLVNREKREIERIAKGK
jgi:hypothetical protein